MQAMKNFSINKYVTFAVIYFISTITLASFHFLSSLSENLYAAFPLLGFLTLSLMCVSGIMFLGSLVLLFAIISGEQKDNHSER